MFSLVLADLTRQYKTMQTEMTLRIHTLEKQLAILQEKLGMYKGMVFVMHEFLQKLFMLGVSHVTNVLLV